MTFDHETNSPLGAVILDTLRKACGHGEPDVTVDAPRPKNTVYVAGASSEMGRVTRFIARLRKAGYAITFDWPAQIRSSGKPANVGLTHDERFAAWSACMEGVESAGTVIALAPRNGRTTKGMWAEMGIAIARGMVPIYVGHVDDTIATSMCEVVDSDDAAFAALEAR